MSMLPPAHRPDVRRDLDQVVHSLQTTADGQFSGDAHFGSSLVGPPGRLHGGLHAYTRLLSVWAALDGALPDFVRLELDLLQPLRLDTRSPFRGSFDGSVLQTTFLEDRRLSGRATRLSSLPAGPSTRLRTLLVDNPLQMQLDAAGTVPVELGQSVAAIRAPSPAAADRGNTLARYLTLDDSADAVWACTALDLLAAVVQGVAWQSHVFTVRMDLSIATHPTDRSVCLLADRTTTPDSLVRLAPVSKGGPMKVAVWMGDADLHTTYAHGDITLYPARHRLV